MFSAPEIVSLCLIVLFFGGVHPPLMPPGPGPIVVGKVVWP